MKKAISCLLALTMLLVFSLGAVAESVDFVVSITNKGAPSLVVIDTENGQNVIGRLRNAAGELLSTEHDDCVVITSVSDAPNSTTIPEDAKNLLLSVYDELKDNGTQLSVLCPGLNDLVADKLGEGKNADALVVRDVFDISSVCEDLSTHLPEDGTTLDLTFDLSVGDELVAAMVYVDGAWQVVPTVNNGDGTVTCTFEELCPVAFMVPGTDSDNAGGSGNVGGGSDNVGGGSSGEPATGDTTSTGTLILWSALMVVSLSAIVVLVVYRRKKDAQNG